MRTILKCLFEQFQVRLTVREKVRSFSEKAAEEGTTDSLVCTPGTTNPSTAASLAVLPSPTFSPAPRNRSSRGDGVWN